MKSVRNLLLLLIATCFVGCSGVKTEKPSGYPMFWTWLDYRPGMNFDSICGVMNDAGIDGVMLNAPTPDDYRVAIPIAHRHGIEVYAWLWTMNLEHDRDAILKEHPEWFSVNRKGESLADTRAYVDYYKFMCPALPEVREHIRKKIVAYCEVEGLNGIAIDYHRLVDVILPTTLWPRYGIVQDREYPEWDFGYHPAMIELFVAQYGYDPRELEDPSTDDQWLQFRCDQVTEVANEIAAVVHSYDKVMAASPFPTPNMSKRMVRQDWGKWNLDIVFPMVYHNFYTRDVSFIADCTIDNVKQKNDMTTLYCGMTGTNGPEMFECMDAALNNGAEGVAIFTVNSLRSPEVRKQFKAYADSVRAMRAESKINPALRGQTEVNVNPFENKGIMKMVDYRMRSYLTLPAACKKAGFKAADQEAFDNLYNRISSTKSIEELTELFKAGDRRNQDLNPVMAKVASPMGEVYRTLSVSYGDYDQTDAYGTTVVYQVRENNSGVAFNVTFYLYGGLIAGWDVSPDEASYKQYRQKI